MLKKTVLTFAFLTILTTFYGFNAQFSAPATDDALNALAEMHHSLLPEGSYVISAYDNLIRNISEEEGHDWRLMSAIAYHESRFTPDITSRSGARGLMQMTEETFLWLRSKLGLGEEVSFGDLYDPDVSIRFGCYYLHLCLVRYNGDISTAAAAYHSGWGTVDALLQKEEHSEDGLTLSGFPYNQMHHYVEKITACYAKYTELYGA